MAEQAIAGLIAALAAVKADIAAAIRIQGGDTAGAAFTDYAARIRDLRTEEASVAVGSRFDPAPVVRAIAPEPAETQIQTVTAAVGAFTGTTASDGNLTLLMTGIQAAFAAAGVETGAVAAEGTYRKLTVAGFDMTISARRLAQTYSFTYVRSGGAAQVQKTFSISIQHAYAYRIRLVCGDEFFALSYANSADGYAGFNHLVTGMRGKKTDTGEAVLWYAAGAGSTANAFHVMGEDTFAQTAPAVGADPEIPGGTVRLVPLYADTGRVTLNRGYAFCNAELAAGGVYALGGAPYYIVRDGIAVC